jgi:hypothetical protein
MIEILPQAIYTVEITSPAISVVEITPAPSINVEVTSAFSTFADLAYVNSQLALKENLIAPGTTTQYWRGDKTWQTLNKSDVGLGNVDNTSDLSKPISTATQAALNLKYDASNPAGYITAASAPVQSVNGKTGVVVVTKFDVSLGNVNNTSDLNKPISAATQTALNAKQDLLLFTPEDVANKSTNTALGTSDTLYPSQKAVKTYVDTAVSGASAPDATTTTKGVVKLAGDLAGTADLPTVPGLAGKEPTITAGTTSQYFRGDKTFQTLDKNAVGLSNVDNTSDLSKDLNKFEKVSKNLRSYPASFAYSGSSLSSITYQTGVSTFIVKTFNYTAGALTSIVLSGNLPSDLGGITTKTISYSAGKISSLSYS